MEILVDKTIFVFPVLFPFSICNAKKLFKRLKNMYIVTSSDGNA